MGVVAKSKVTLDSIQLDSQASTLVPVEEDHDRYAIYLGFLVIAWLRCNTFNDPDCRWSLYTFGYALEDDNCLFSAATPTECLAHLNSMIKGTL